MSDFRERSRAVTAEILHLMGIPARVQAEDVNGEIRVTVDAGDEADTVIGPRGDGLHSLQYIVTRVINSEAADDDRIQLTIDVGGYVDKREQELVDRAMAMADEARQTGKEQVLEPMGSSDRRIVHRALTDQSDLVTYSLGNGPVKRLVIGLADAEKLTEGDLPAPRYREREERGGRGDRRRTGPMRDRDRDRDRTADRDRGQDRDRPRSSERARDDRPGSRGPRRPSNPDVRNVPSDGRVRDLISGTPSPVKGAGGERKSTFRIVHMPPGMRDLPAEPPKEQSDSED